MNATDATQLFIENEFAGSTGNRERDEMILLKKAKQLLSNRHIILLGDSLTRYQYLNLIHTLQRNSWEPSIKPSIDNGKHWKNWEQFLVGATLRFGCQEICDCYRNEETALGKENRYYYDPVHNISISLFFFVASLPLHMNDPPTNETFFHQCSNYEIVRKELSNYHTRNVSKHTYHDKIDFFRDAIAPLNPDLVMLNIGTLERAFSQKTLDDFDGSLLRMVNETFKNFVY